MCICVPNDGDRTETREWIGMTFDIFLPYLELQLCVQGAILLHERHDAGVVAHGFTFASAAKT